MTKVISDIKQIGDIDVMNARATGYKDARKAFTIIMHALENEANQAFQLQRETDSGYQDVRTDYLLGKLDFFRKQLSDLGELT